MRTRRLEDYLTVPCCCFWCWGLFLQIVSCLSPITYHTTSYHIIFFSFSAHPSVYFIYHPLYIYLYNISIESSYLSIHPLFIHRSLSIYPSPLIICIYISLSYLFIYLHIVSVHQHNINLSSIGLRLLGSVFLVDVCVSSITYKIF